MKDFALNALVLLFNFMRKYYWFVILLGLVVYFVYQVTFSWDKETEVNAQSKSMNEDEVILLVLKENHYGVKRNGFNSLSERLKTWEFDEDNKKVYLKFNSLFPKNNTNVVLIYDRGFDSFKHYSEVLSISSFPYQYYFDEDPVLTVHNIDKNGTVYLDFKGKRIKLDSNGSYPDVTVKGFQIVQTKIVNYGIYQKSQFLPLKTEEDEKRKSKNKNETTDSTTSENLEESTDNAEDEVIKKPIVLPNIHE